MKEQMPQNTELMAWSDDLSMGVEKIDNQHKKLISLTNDLITHIPGDEDSEKAYLKNLLKELVDYIKFHFSTEEELMAKTEFAGLKEHKAQHETFVFKVVDQVKEFNNGKPFDHLEFTNFLKNWVLNHIAKTDKLYARYFKETVSFKAEG